MIPFPVISFPSARIMDRISLIMALVPATLLAQVIRQAWILPARLQGAEALWSIGRPPQEVLQRLGSTRLAGGELGYRIRQLQGLALMASGGKEQARGAFRRAALCRLPFWTRWPIRLYMHWTTTHPETRHPAWGLHLLKLAPGMGQLRFLVAQQMLRTGEQQTGWELLAQTVPLSANDPLMLEDLMILGLGRIQAQDEPSPHLGVQDLHPELPYVFEESFNQLRHRYGDPRIGWDRTLPARYLSQKGRHREVVTLVLGLPPARRSITLWEILLVSLRHLKDKHGLREALRSTEDLRISSFRIQMDRFEAFMEDQRFPEGQEALEKAWACLPPETQAQPEPSRWEWLANRASYAHWIEKDSARALECLEAIPERGRNPRIQLLGIQVLAALGRYEEAHAALKPLLDTPGQDPDLHLLQAEILAGLEAWEALLPYLDQHQEALKSRADFWHLAGLAHAHLKDPVRAREPLERAAYMNQSNLDFILDAGHSCMDLSEFERAEQHWRQALKLDEQCEEALIQLAETRRSLHDDEGARRLLRECLLHHPDSLEAQSFLAELEAN